MIIPRACGGNYLVMMASRLVERSSPAPVGGMVNFLARCTRYLGPPPPLLGTPGTVLPRACGENLRVKSDDNELCGPPPRLWGEYWNRIMSHNPTSQRFPDKAPTEVS